jgi:hypothetical protein
MLYLPPSDKGKHSNRVNVGGVLQERGVQMRMTMMEKGGIGKAPAAKCVATDENAHSSAAVRCTVLFNHPTSHRNPAKALAPILLSLGLLWLQAETSANISCHELLKGKTSGPGRRWHYKAMVVVEGEASLARRGKPRMTAPGWQRETTFK